MSRTSRDKILYPVISKRTGCFTLSLSLSLPLSFIRSPLDSPTRFRCSPALRFSASLVRTDWLLNRPIINLSSGFPWKAKPVRWRVIGRCLNHSTVRINQVCGPSAGPCLSLVSHDPRVTPYFASSAGGHRGLIVNDQPIPLDRSRPRYISTGSLERESPL